MVIGQVKSMILYLHTATPGIGLTGIGTGPGPGLGPTTNSKINWMIRLLVITTDFRGVKPRVGFSNRLPYVCDKQISWLFSTGVLHFPYPRNQITDTYQHISL